MTGELMAATRDASWYDHPDVTTPKRAHIAVIAGRDGRVWSARCDPRVPLDETIGRPAAMVPELLRCQRPGCRARWPDAETTRARRLAASADPMWRDAAQEFLDGRYTHICVPYDLGGSCTSPHPAKGGS